MKGGILWGSFGRALGRTGSGRGGSGRSLWSRPCWKEVKRTSPGKLDRQAILNRRQKRQGVQKVSSRLKKRKEEVAWTSRATKKIYETDGRTRISKRQRRRGLTIPEGSALKAKIMEDARKKNRRG